MCVQAHTRLDITHDIAGIENINDSKKVKEHSVQQALLLSSNHPVVWPCCTQARAFIELPLEYVNSQGFNVSVAVHNLTESKLLW
jgi:hypothetical protein